MFALLARFFLVFSLLFRFSYVGSDSWCRFIKLLAKVIKAQIVYSNQWKSSLPDYPLMKRKKQFCNYKQIRVREREEEDFYLVGCFLTANIIRFPAMKSTMANLWHPIRGVQICDMEEKRYLFQFIIHGYRKGFKGITMIF